MTAKTLVRTALLAVLFAAILTPRTSWAKGLTCKGKRDFGFGSAEAFAAVLHANGLVVNGADTPRRLVGVPAPGGGAPLLGGGLALQVRCDYLIFDVFTLRVAGALGGGDVGRATANGDSIAVTRGTLGRLELGLPWLGIPNGFQVFPDPDWKVSFKLDAGASRVWSSATLLGGDYGRTGGSVDDWTLFLRADLGVCRHLKTLAEGASTAWACLTVSPTLYENVSLPGGTLGVRVDL